LTYLKGVGIDAKTIIIIAVPDTNHQVVFHFEDGPYSAIIPPGYISRERFAHIIHEDLISVMGKTGNSLAILSAPLKNIAVRLGLVSYGRNNLTYIDGLGSYYRLVGFVTDSVYIPATWPENHTLEVMLPACQGCSACQEACPTGAINAERVLLHAERCLTAFNESTRAFPEWLPASAHNCLIGCLTCQLVCPQNRGLLKLVQDRTHSFSQEETSAILSANANAERNDLIWGRIKTKLSVMGLMEYEPNLSRNLRACIK